MSELWHRGRRGLVREFLEACLGADWPGRPAQAQRLLDDLPEEVPAFGKGGRAPAKERGRTGVDKSALPFAPQTGPSQRDRRAMRNVRVGALRIAVLKRARAWFGNVCEFCHAGEPVHMHHVLKGSERVAEEDEATCAAICEGCDTRTESAPAEARVRALEWARRLARESRRRKLDDLAVRFDRTAAIMEGKIALAGAQAKEVRRA